MEKVTPPNRSNAVMQTRIEPADSLDFFPTPAWGTRALMEKVLHFSPQGASDLVCLEPACGAGHMVKPLTEYFGEVVPCDIHDYGYPGMMVQNFLGMEEDPDLVDWIITNPPFKLAEEFIKKSMRMARRGAAFLVRTSFLESVGRYNSLYSITPPQVVAQFTERVPMFKGRVDKKGSTATSYAWLVWEKGSLANYSKIVWIPPCRKSLERDTDYD